MLTFVATLAFSIVATGAVNTLFAHLAIRRRTRQSDARRGQKE